MTKKLMDYYAAQRRIFGICPRCDHIFRLSDVHIQASSRSVGQSDWMHQFGKESERIDGLTMQLNDQEVALREQARAIGRTAATKAIQKVDRLFHPRRMTAEEAKVLFHPVDYLVFHGMKCDSGVTKLVFLDRTPTTKEHRGIQKSIRRAIDRRRVRWVTLRVTDSGSIRVEDGP